MNKHTLIKWFQENYPDLVKAMSESSHHYSKEILNKYHLEGDVWTHTCMVLNEVSSNGTNFNNHLLVAALLHDIGKSASRKVNEEKKRVHFFGHEPLSAFMAINILDEIEEHFKINLNKKLLLEVIAIHTDVFKLSEEKLTDRLVGKAGLAVLLIELSRVDSAGRFHETENEDRIIQHLPITEKIESKSKKSLLVMIGLPCSGKSTFVEDLDGYKVLSRDSIVMEVGAELGFTNYNDSFNNIDQKEVDKRFQNRRKELILNNDNVIIDMTNMGRKSRRKNMQGFKDYHKSAVVIFSPLDLIMDRNKNREGKSIPDHVFDKMIMSFQPPLYDEFDEITWEFNK